jgi:uncharacterized protein YoxC
LVARGRGLQMTRKKLVARLQITAAAMPEDYNVLMKTRKSLADKVNALGKEIREFNKRVDRTSTLLDSESGDMDYDGEDEVEFNEIIKLIEKIELLKLSEIRFEDDDIYLS